MTKVHFSCERAAPCVQEGCGCRRGTANVVPSRNNLCEICKCVFYGDGGDRYWWQPRIDKSRVLVQNLHCEQRNVPPLCPCRFSQQPATERRHVSAHRIRSTRYVEGVLLVLAEVVEKHSEKNGNIFSCELRGVLRHGEPFSDILLGDTMRLTTISLVSE